MINYDNLPTLTGNADDVSRATEARDSYLHRWGLYKLDVVADAGSIADTLRMWADVWTLHTDSKRAYELTKAALEAFWAVPAADGYYSDDKAVNQYMAVIASYTDAAWWVKNRGAYANEIARDLIKSVDKEAN